MRDKLMQLVLHHAPNERYSLSEWLHDEHLKVYVRVGLRYVDNQLARFLTISNVIVDRRCRRRGHYSRLISLCEDVAAEARLAGVYVENVLEVSQFGIYERRGYTKVPALDYIKDIGFEPRSWYKLNESIRSVSAA